MYEIIKEYSGKGTFNFCSPSKEINLDLDLGFNLIQFSNSNIELTCHFLEVTPETFYYITVLTNNFANDDMKVSMNGEVESNGNIKVEEAYITKINFDFKPTELNLDLKLRTFKPVEIIYENINSGDIKIYAGLTNFIFNGCQKIVNPHDGFKINIEDYEVFFIQNENYSEKIESFENEEKKILVTSEALINLSKENDFKFTEIIDNISDLLSYACRTRISPIYEDYYFEDTLLKTVLRPIFTSELNKKNNLIEPNLGNCNLKQFLESSYDHYLKFKDNFALNIVIAFYLESVAHNYTDMAFLLATTTLETLLTGYEELREEEENPITLGLLKRNKKKIKKALEAEGVLISDEIAEKVSEKVSYKNLNIHEKLSAFIKDKRFPVELYNYDRDFSLIRNKIAHTGKFPKVINSNGTERSISFGEEFDRLIYLIDRIILTILDYKEKPFINKLEGSITVLEK